MIFPLNGNHKIHRIHYLGQVNTIKDNDIIEQHLILKLKATPPCATEYFTFNYYDCIRTEAGNKRMLCQHSTCYLFTRR